MIKYVLRTWVNGSFPPSTWVMYNHQGVTTNNHSEGYNYRLGNNRAIEKHPNCYKWAETVVQELRNSENEAIMAKCGNPNSRQMCRKKATVLKWRHDMRAELESGNIDLLSYQQSIGGSIFKHDHATLDDDDFEDPLLERSKQNDDEEIIVPELWEITAPLPVVEVPSLPHSGSVLSFEVEVPSLPQSAPVPPPLSPLPHTPAPYRQVNGRKRMSEVSHSVVGAGLRQKRRRLAVVPPSLPADVTAISQSLSAVEQHFPEEIDKKAYFAFYGHPKTLTLEQGQFLLKKRLEELGFHLSENLTPGDGSCLFHGLLDQLKSNPNLRDEASTHEELRWKIVNYGYDFFLKTGKLARPGQSRRRTPSSTNSSISNTNNLINFF